MPVLEFVPGRAALAEPVVRGVNKPEALAEPVAPGAPNYARTHSKIDAFARDNR
jgi:hypothetical protein